MVLLTRAILSFKLNFYIPISKVGCQFHPSHYGHLITSPVLMYNITSSLHHHHITTSPSHHYITITSPHHDITITSSLHPRPHHLQMQENMKRATHRDAVNSQQFFFRQQVLPTTEDLSAEQRGDSPPSEQEYLPMSIDAIVNGQEGFYGLVPLVRMYVDSVDMDVDTRCTVLRYLSFISKKASGVCVCVCMCVCLYVCLHVCVCMLCICLCVHMCVCACMFVCTCCMSVCIYIYMLLLYKCCVIMACVYLWE